MLLKFYKDWVALQEFKILPQWSLAKLSVPSIYAVVFDYLQAYYLYLSYVTFAQEFLSSWCIDSSMPKHVGIVVKTFI